MIQEKNQELTIPNTQPAHASNRIREPPGQFKKAVGDEIQRSVQYLKNHTLQLSTGWYSAANKNFSTRQQIPTRYSLAVRITTRLAIRFMTEFREAPRIDRNEWPFITRLVAVQDRAKHRPNAAMSHENVRHFGPGARKVSLPLH
jgi:hypothetical protein